MKCGDCKFWSEPDAAEAEVDEQTQFRECKRIPMFSRAFEWVEDRDMRKLKEEFKDVIALAQDGEDYIAELRTKENFGCVLFEAKVAERRKTNLTSLEPC